MRNAFRGIAGGVESDWKSFSMVRNDLEPLPKSSAIYRRAFKTAFIPIGNHRQALRITCKPVGDSLESTSHHIQGIRRHTAVYFV